MVHLQLFFSEIKVEWVVRLILASTSKTRQLQLRNMGVDFTAVSPICDEAPLSGESAADTALRLAIAKANSLRTRYEDSLIIGADQVACLNNQHLGKPMSVAAAREMLSALSGQIVVFYSALCLLNSTTGTHQTHVDITRVHLRPFSRAQIEQYLHREPDAIYCAGAAKSEGLGAVLIRQIDSVDPNALLGLPIFKLTEFLFDQEFPIL